MNAAVFSRAGDDFQPSPSIWGNCPLHRLIDEGSGYFFHQEFLGGVRSTATTAATPLADGFVFVGDTDTITTSKAGELGGYLDIETDGDDNDGAAIVNQPWAMISKGSGKKVWFEARIELGAIADQGVFVGLGEAAALTHDVVADDAAALIGESLIGFQILADDTDGVDAVYKLDDGSAVTIKSVMNSSAITADTEFKVGLHFDGQETISVYFDGVKAGSVVVSNSTFPVNVALGSVLAIKTGTGAAQSFAIDWVRGAYLARP